MPVIEMYMPEGVLDDETKAALQEGVSRNVMEAEGASWSHDFARSITWLLIHEVAGGNWAVGGAPIDADPRVLTRITVPEGAVGKEKCTAVAAAVQDAIVAALGDDYGDPTRSFCVVEDHAFGAAGAIVDYQRLVALLDSPTMTAVRSQG